jgi:hypothetical protein
VFARCAAARSSSVGRGTIFTVRSVDAGGFCAAGGLLGVNAAGRVCVTIWRMTRTADVVCADASCCGGGSRGGAVVGAACPKCSS